MLNTQLSNMNEQARADENNLLAMLGFVSVQLFLNWSRVLK